MHSDRLFGAGPETALLAFWVAFLAGSLFLTLFLAAKIRRQRSRVLLRPRRAPRRVPQPSRSSLCRPKAPWVRSEVLRLRALMPHDGCRKIAAAFNRIHEGRDSVSKSYVARLIRDHQLEILRLRRELKHREPTPLPRNLIWALDLTYLPGDRRPVLAILDHGTRACLLLRTLSGRSSLDILAALAEAVRHFGFPRYLRTDNESSLVSATIRLALAGLGIRHQRTEPLCPWQNGRVERFFSTCKQRLLPWLEIGERLHTQDDLDLLRRWYNHARPHQHLQDATPAEVWDGRNVRSAKDHRFFSAWNGLLAGFYRPK